VIKRTSFGPLAEIWDAKSGNEGVKSMRHNTKTLISLLGKPKGKLVYEIATGNGFLARKLSDAGAIVTASDISPELIDIATHKYDVKNIKYSVREATNFKGLGKNKFDAVIIHQGIFYIKNIDALAKGASSILKPGGVMIFTMLHPLFRVLKARTEEGRAADRLAEIFKQAEAYRTNTGKETSKKWKVDKTIHKINYYAYRRPLNFYVNALAKHGLFTQQIIEPASKNVRDDKIINSPIPSIYIVKVVKI